MFSRFNNVLTQKEITSLDNSILNLEYSINNYLQSASSQQKEKLIDDFNKATSDYHRLICSYKENEQKNMIIAQKVEQLYELTPREFEEWTESLLNELDYSNVILTPQSGDKGIDLICEKDGKKIAVQCKRFKGVVGTPLLQSFAGAIQAAEMDKGLFITTGTFSIGAEIMAESLPIELFDKVSLRELIRIALNKHKTD